MDFKERGMMWGLQEIQSISTKTLWLRSDSARNVRISNRKKWKIHHTFKLRNKLMFL